MWTALIGGAVAWTLHLLLAYAVAEFGCVAGLGHTTWIGISIVSWMLLGVSILCTLLAVASFLIANNIGRRAADLPPDVEHRETADFVARFGVIINGLFTFIIVVESIPIFFFLGRC